MTPGARVAAFAALLAVIFTAAVLAGRALDPGSRPHGADGRHAHAGAPGRTAAVAPEGTP